MIGSLKSELTRLAAQVGDTEPSREPENTEPSRESAGTTHLGDAEDSEHSIPFADTGAS